MTILAALARRLVRAQFRQTIVERRTPRRLRTFIRKEVAEP